MESHLKLKCWSSDLQRRRALWENKPSNACPQQPHTCRRSIPACSRLSCLCLPSFISLVAISSENLWPHTVQPKAQRNELFKHQTEPARHKGSYSLKPVDSNFLADPGQQILNPLTEPRLAHHLSAELAQGSRLFPRPICVPCHPHEMGLAPYQRRVFKENSRKRFQCSPPPGSPFFAQDRTA